MVQKIDLLDIFIKPFLRTHIFNVHILTAEKIKIKKNIYPLNNLH